MSKVNKKLQLVYMKSLFLDTIKIDSVLNGKKDVEQLYQVHCEMDGKFQSHVNNWGRGMYGWNDSFGFDYNSIEDSKSMLEHNLRMMKGKLEAYKFTFTEEDVANQQVKSTTNIYNTTNNIYFERVTQYIENNYTAPDKGEILQKIDEIKGIINSTGSKEDKWSKLSKIGKWILDKSVDVGMQLLPLILGLK